MKIAFFTYPHCYTPILRGQPLIEKGHDVYFLSLKGFYYKPSTYQAIKCIKIENNVIINSRKIKKLQQREADNKLESYPKIFYRSISRNIYEKEKLFPNSIYKLLRRANSFSRNAFYLSLKWINNFKRNILKNINQLLIYIQLYRITIKLKIDILHIVDMSYCTAVLFSGARKTVIENNGSDVLVHPKNNYWIRIAYRFCYQFVDGVIQDSWVAQKAGMKYGAKQRLNEVIPNGVFTEEFNQSVNKGVIRKRYNISDDTKLVFSPRSPRSLYNLDIIIESIPKVKKSVSNVLYFFCGLHFADEYVESLKQTANLLNVNENIIFGESVEWLDEMKYYYTDSDLVISVPSSDSWPASVMEAISCGTPVIISELSWYKREFIEGEDFITVPVRDKNALADATVKILHGENYINTNNARQKVIKKFSSQYQSDKLDTFYKNL